MMQHSSWLNGPFERAQWSPLRTAILGLLLAFVLFQLVISPLALMIGILWVGEGPGALMDLPGLMRRWPGVLLAANTAGQLLGLALPALVLARLHTSHLDRFLRFQSAPTPMVVGAMVGWACLLPVVQWLGQVNAALPLPESLRAFDELQMALITAALEGGLGLIPNLLMLAVVPALCEEVLFRGYVQRQAERSLGIVGGIVFSGLVFGLYHLRLTQVLPLCLLGIYLAYLVWKSGSLWTAVIVHLANNAFSVLLAMFAHQRGITWQAIEAWAVPWYAVVGGLVGFCLVVYILQKFPQSLTSGESDEA
jgi:membrane protease YdiL (CAAX protease family)